MTSLRESIRAMAASVTATLPAERFRPLPGYGAPGGLMHYFNLQRDAPDTTPDTAFGIAHRTLEGELYYVLERSGRMTIDIHDAYRWPTEADALRWIEARPGFGNHFAVVSLPPRGGAAR